MLIPNPYEMPDEEKDLWFQSEMNYRHFAALAHKLNNSDVENEILNNEYFNKVSKSLKYSNIEVAQWLKNSWNTERVLFHNLEIIDNTKQSFCMQWAFPQAYYTVFGNIIAMFKSIGFTETSHTAVLKKYSNLMTESKLPESISICCDGIEKGYSFYNINQPQNIHNHMELDFDNPDSIDNLICQFLKTTRKQRLKEKAPKMNFKTQKGEKRKSLTRKHWERVSSSLGATSVIDFLYRKRIKGNYQDIEVYNYQYFKGFEVIKHLLLVVDKINLVNETYIAKAIGIHEFNEMAEYQLCKVDNKALKLRLEIVNEIIRTCY